MRGFLALGALLAISLIVGCGRSGKPSQATETLLPPETFEFAPQAVTFSPPPAPWTAENAGSGGLRGVRYVKRGSVGEAIGVADYYDVSQRFRQAALDRLLAADPNLESFAFEHALRDAWCRSNPYTELERATCSDIDRELNRASAARRARDYDGVRDALASARGHADRLHFTLGDVIEPAMFKPEASENARRYALVGRRDGSIGGEPAVVVDYTIDLPEGRRFIRKAYVMHNSSLYVADFIGLESSLPLFDRVAASISFPP